MSISSFLNFTFINGFLGLVSLSQYACLFYQPRAQINRFLLHLLVYVTRNYALLHFIDYGTRNKPLIDDVDTPTESYKYEFHVNVITTTAVECVTHLFITNSRSTLYGIVYFIPVSFMFEIVFDFFHYIGHRLLHHKYFYKYLHKKHHTFKHPIAITTFYQDPLDLIISNSLPTILTLLIFPNISYLQFHFIVVYKNFIEISGHTGKILYPSCSFPQFIWLPKILHIELYAEKHDLHHSLNNCNYSKRFSLWDKLFGTYK